MTRHPHLAEDILTRYAPATPEAHAMASWTNHPHQGWAKGYRTAPIVLDELYLAAGSMPIVFEPFDGGARPVALIDCGAGNMIMDNGHWAGAYVPGILRAHPFAATPEGEVRLDPDSEFLHDGPVGKRLFDPLGKPTPEFEKVQTFCAALGPALRRAQALGSALFQAGVLQPASKLSDLDAEVTDGLLAASPAKLRALDAELAPRLLQSDALALAYAHLASLPKINQLKFVSRVRHSRPAADEASASPAAGGVDSFLAALAVAHDRDGGAS